MKRILHSLNSLFSSPTTTFLSVLLAVIATFRVFIFYWNKYFLPKELIGDEGIFLSFFELMLREGWYVANAAGSSPLFNLLGLLFYYLIGDSNYALKSLGIFSYMLTVLVWFRFAKKDLEIKGTLLLQLMATLLMAGILRNHYFKISNDGLFVLFISLLFVTLHQWQKNRRDDFNSIKAPFLSGLWLALAVSTRELILFYLPGLLLILLFIIFIRKENRVKEVGIFLCTVVIILLTIHFPSIIENGSLSIQSKQPKELGLTWSQRNYLSLQMGKSDPVTWAEVQEYIVQNGEQSLPKTEIESILFDPSFTLKRFLTDVFSIPKPMLRNIGALFLLFLLIPAYSLLTREIQFNTYLPILFFLLFVGALCIQILPNMQFRWLLLFPYFISTFSIYQAKLLLNQKLLQTIININILIISVLNILLSGLW